MTDHDPQCICEPSDHFLNLELLIYDPMCPVHGQIGIS
jgi:hypothetical protein